MIIDFFKSLIELLSLYNKKRFTNKSANIAQPLSVPKHCFDFQSNSTINSLQSQKQVTALKTMKAQLSCDKAKLL